MAIEAGRLLNERYRLIRPVGQGSQASVWVAEHLALTTQVAVKLISQELAKKDSARERFRREATAAAQLRSAHVVQILDHGIDGDQPFIVMELLDGEDLFERLAHRVRLSVRETSKIVTQVARALSRAHAANIVHRDLKPENVFLVPNDDDEVVKVLDFGVAKVKDAAKVTMQKTGVGTLIGTPHYMSPEQVKGIGEVDFHADLWALGIIAFQCVTGELPFDSEGVGDLLIKITIGDAPVPSKVYPGVPANFDTWFAKACARDQSLRFHSAKEMALALAGVVGVVEGVLPRPPTVRPPAPSNHAGHLGLVDAVGAAGVETRPSEPHEVELDDWDEASFDESGARAALGPNSAKIPRAPVSFGSGVGKPSSMGGGPPSPSPRAPPRSEAVTLPALPALSVDGTSANEPSVTSNGPSVVVHASTRGARGAHEVVDFDETIPAHDLAVPDEIRAAWDRAEGNAPKAPTPAAGASSAVARPKSGSLLALPPGPPAGPSSARAPLPSIILPDNGANAPWESSGPVGPASGPRPQEPAGAGHGSTRTVGGPVRPNGETQFEASHTSLSLVEDAPFDGHSKQQRITRWFLGGLVVLAVGVTAFVVKSQLGEGSDPAVGSAGVPASVVAPPPLGSPTNAPSTRAVPPSLPISSTAVDPGRVTHPGKPAPSTKPTAWPRGASPGRHPPKPSDTSVVIPDGEE